MNCTITCDCGRSIDATPSERHPECPTCGATYAVTITQIGQPVRNR